VWCELSGVEKNNRKNFQKLLTFYEPRGNILLVADEATKNPIIVSKGQCRSAK
jgi:hypothetical protein